MDVRMYAVIEGVVMCLCDPPCVFADLYVYKHVTPSIWTILCRCCDRKNVTKKRRVMMLFYTRENEFHTRNACVYKSFSRV